MNQIDCTKESHPFSICIICQDDYREILERHIQNGHDSILLVYLGNNADSCEEYIQSKWKTNSNIELSTFAEPPTFFHCNLASEVYFSPKITKEIQAAVIDARSTAAKKT